MHRGHIGIRQINLIDDRHNGESLFVREVNIRYGLRFDSLRRIDNQQRALARSEATRNFIAEIDVPGSVEQVQSIVLPGFARVTHRHWMRFDRDPALPLQVH